MTRYQEKLFSLAMFLLNFYFKAFPVVYALMTHKTKRLYIELLEFVKTKVFEFTNKQINPQLVVTDFESGLQQALVETLQCRIRGCWFHFN